MVDIYVSGGGGALTVKSNDPNVKIIQLKPGDSPPKRA